MRITFKSYDDDSDNREHEAEVSIEGPCITLEEILTQFEHFIKACGYHPKGQLEFIEDD